MPTTALSAATVRTAVHRTTGFARETVPMGDAIDGHEQMRRIEVGDVEVAARTLAAAFATDPVFRWMSSSPDAPAEKFVAAFVSLIRNDLRHDAPEIFMAPGGGCVTLWHGIDAWKSSPVDSLRVTPGFVRSFGIRHVGRLLRTQAALDAAHPSAPHYHLAFIGTDPSQQGQGLGSSTLDPMLERCDLEGVPAYLESSNPVNDAFYVRKGFVVTDSVHMPDGCPPVNAMWREPRS